MPYFGRFSLSASAITLHEISLIIHYGLSSEPKMKSIQLNSIQFNFILKTNKQTAVSVTNRASMYVDTGKQCTLT